MKTWIQNKINKCIEAGSISSSAYELDFTTLENVDTAAQIATRTSNVVQFSTRIDGKALASERVVPNGTKLVQTSSQLVSIDVQNHYK